jgi:hypothetical protein
MEGTLIKRNENDYRLFVNDVPFAQVGDNPYKKLSLKNSQAIELGYDLEELAEENYPSGDVWTPEQSLVRKLAFNKGFQKALEILGDKKYSETELYRAFLINSAGNDTTLRNFFEQTVLPTFQQNEWNVEIDMWFHGTRYKKGEWIPRLDDDNCLILKRK